MNSNIQDYIDLVRSGKIEVCKDQLLLCDMVERVFSTCLLYTSKMTRSELKQYIDDALEIALSECTSDNPLEAWTQFMDKLDVSARRRIGDRCV